MDSLMKVMCHIRDVRKKMEMMKQTFMSSPSSSASSSSSRF